ncbi:type II toxin-antitoxin system RelE/ParE family toxin [Nostoc sp. FACHB-280]|uniref:type II toxin-antitoxin system RelE/ParE family toxin n=1 Tax=Nostoc sp. FACHB-280 TaxID=2692839 RepID=UPI00168A4F36|nr:type II toxin-antitoxin system RelE/ParE family toxin [Nostoc sp. FACHB-280]MBD2498249.1 type II toxin-antitoxin system RelE/ParE family toxin [Nostoc sp. FACHB-280]
MGRFIRTAKAEEDLIEIWIYIATDNPTAADKLLDQIDTKCQMLADNPELGQARPDIASGLRYFPVNRYLILYRKISEGIEVIRVVHGARHLPDMF